MEEYNERGNNKLQLVLFDDALQHLTRIQRVLRRCRARTAGRCGRLGKTEPHQAGRVYCRYVSRIPYSVFRIPYCTVSMRQFNDIVSFEKCVTLSPGVADLQL